MILSCDKVSAASLLFRERQSQSRSTWSSWNNGHIHFSECCGFWHHWGVKNLWPIPTSYPTCFPWVQPMRPCRPSSVGRRTVTWWCRPIWESTFGELRGRWRGRWRVSIMEFYVTTTIIYIYIIYIYVWYVTYVPMMYVCNCTLHTDRHCITLHCITVHFII